MKTCNISFAEQRYKSLELPLGANLSEWLNLDNSPVLFGCRTGICGTCLVRTAGNLPPPSADEAELLDMLSPGQPNVRLACQLSLQSDITIVEYLGDG